MSKIERVEDIKAWREARSIVGSVYKLTCDGPWARDYGLRDQVRRAAVSIACNIAEGFARETDVEFARFLFIARGSAAEVKTQMYIALDLGYVDQMTFQAMYARLDEVSRMITGFIQYLRTERSNRLTTVD